MMTKFQYNKTRLVSILTGIPFEILYQSPENISFKYASKTIALNIHNKLLKLLSFNRPVIMNCDFKQGISLSRYNKYGIIHNNNFQAEFVKVD